jgi:2-polyprenyl-3-methyl-5-hydroxy-6-metoxy-1,4-benzoquinol methylase
MTEKIGANENQIEKQAKMKDYYNNTPYYDNLLETFSNLKSPFQLYRVRKILEIYSPRKDERVLDLGCGWGTFTFSLAPNVKEIIGLDYSDKSISICNNLKKNYDDANISFIQKDSYATGLDDSSIDTIVCADLVEHLYPDVFLKTLDEAGRVLKPGGKFIIWTPYKGHFLEKLRNYNIIVKHDPSHVDFKSMENLKKSLEERNFKVLKYYYAESHIPILRTVEILTLAFLPFMRRRIAILAEKQ